MATYLSQPYQGSEFVSGVPIDLITKVGMMKQMKYDQTVASIQGAIDEVGEQDIIKDSERNYVSNKLRDTVNQLNQFGGVDLTQGPTASRLKSYVSNLKRDPRIYNAIADTRAIRNNMAQLAEIKEKRPGEYASQNEALFMQGINSYLNSPEGTRYSGQAYTPYYNYDENYRKIATEIQKNPDIQSDIQYVIMPDGTKRARSTQEIKQVTKEKIQQALLQSGDTRALRQMQIDYQFTLPNKTTEGAVSELKNERDSALQQLKEAKDLVAQGISDPNTLKQVQNVINNLEGDGNENAGYIKQLDGKIAEVRATGDPTKYYSFDKYVKDYTSGLAKSYAYEQKGKIDYDDMFIEDYKFAHNLQLEQVKASIALEKEKAKASGSSADLEGFTDSFTNTFFNIEENPNREGNIDDAGMYSLFDATKNTDGTGTLTLGQGETFLNLGRVLEANGIVEQNASKINGYSQFTRAYNEWTKTQDGGRNVTVDTPGSRTGVVHKRINKPIEEFLNTQKGKDLAAQIKNSTGLDVSNNVDVENLKRFAASPDAIETVEFGNKLSKLRGQVKIRPMDGMNMFAGSDNQYYGKMQGLFTEKELRNAIGDDGFSKLRDKGIIEETLNVREGTGKKEDQPLYSLPLIRKVEKDIGAAYTNYMTTLNSGDNFYTKNLPGYQAKFKNNFDAIVSTRGLNTQTLVSQGQTTLDSLAKINGAGTTDGIQKLNWIRNQYNRAKAVLDSNVSSSADKVNAKKFLQNLITNSQNLSSFAPNDTTNTTPGTVTSNTNPVRQPGQTIAEYANNPGNLKFKGDSPVIRLYGGTDSGVKGGDGGSFARFPDMITGLNAYKAQLFGPTDGLFKSDYYQPWKTVDQALKSYSNYRTVNGQVKGYSGDIYPEIKNKKLEDLTQAERDELTARMLKIENNLVYEQLRSAGVIKT